MKNLSLLAAGLLISGASFAQTTTPAPVTASAPVTTSAAATPNPAVKPAMKDLRHDIRSYRKDKAVAANDVKKGNLTGTQTQLAAAKTEKADIKTDAATLKSDGVAHPIKRADKQIDRTDEKKLGTAVAGYKADKKAAVADIREGKLNAAGTEVADAKAEKIKIRHDAKIAHRDGIAHPFHHKG